MEIPQYLPTFRSIRCSECGKEIGMHLVKARFHCPHCRKELHSNIDRAFLEGFVLSLVAFTAWSGYRAYAGEEIFGVAGSIVFVADFYAAHLWYRRRLKAGSASSADTQFNTGAKRIRFAERFSRKTKSGSAGDWIPLTVLYATDRNGLSAEDGVALRGIIMASAFVDFEYINPGSFAIFFPGTEDGIACAERLSAQLRKYAGRRGASAFGVGIELGSCLVVTDDKGRFISPPFGDTINRAMKKAILEAENAL